MILDKGQLVNVFEDVNFDVIKTASEFRVSVQTVMASLDKYDITFIKPKHIYRDLKRTDFSRFQKSVIIGSVLGDACLEKKGRLTNALFREEHSIKQAEWLKWKHSNLKPFTTSNSWIRKRGGKNIFPDGKGGFSEYITNDTISMATITHPYLTELYNQFYVDKKKVIPKDLLEKEFDFLSLVVFYMDDGSFVSGEIIFCTDPFSKEDVEFLADIFSRFFSGNVGVRKVKTINGVKYRIKFSSLTSDIKFFTEVEKIVPKSLHYKIPQFSTNTKRLLITNK